ncbi:hypothetical protein PHLCEN_2v5661 [Hermanssonia centrifuga]|uniref:Uncharacterized protein n=1 Tax=Hermanssonia centrifuga TaxID=98765 RepID=A0A2R6P1R0_9APHY|nr:hypothetical protein PHLCEN_2v5661 [Hermanssonia centrifuga]
MASSSAMLRIYGISATRDGVNGRASIVIYLHLSTFFELLASKKFGRLHSPEFYPWETWGPKYTRCFDATNHTDDLYAGYGTRIVHNDLLLDFNQSSLMRELHRIQPSGESSNAGSSSTLKFRRGKLKLSHKAALSQPATDNTDPVPHRIVTDPTIIPRGQFFEKDIESSLPYRETPISWPGNVRPHAIYGNEVWIAEANRDPAVSVQRAFLGFVDLLKESQTGSSTYQTLYPASACS